MGRGWKRVETIPRQSFTRQIFFKRTKSLLRLQKEFQGRSYDMLISHTTIVFSRYILLAWQHRQSTDDRTLGNPFLMLCDEVSELDWAVALSQLVELVNNVSKKASKRISILIRGQLQQWITDCPAISRHISLFRSAKVE